MTEKNADPLALGISYSATIGEKRNIVLQTHVPQDSNYLPVLRRMDDSVGVIEAVHDLARNRADLSRHEKDLSRIRSEFERIDSRVKSTSGNDSSRGQRKLSEDDRKEQAERSNVL